MRCPARKRNTIAVTFAARRTLPSSARLATFPRPPPTRTACSPCSLRYLVEDRWPASEQPPTVLSEEQVLGASLEGLIRSEVRGRVSRGARDV